MTNRIYVIGQLNIDYIDSAKTLANQHANASSYPLVGGTAFNAAKALKGRNFEPIIIGKVGHDPHGYLIKQAIRAAGIGFIIQEDEARPTGCCRIVFSDPDHSCQYYKTCSDDANQFDLDYFKRACESIDKEDLVFLAGHFLRHTNPDEKKEFIDILSRKAGRIILDLVPHNIYQSISLAEFNEVVRDRASVIIAEFVSLWRLIAPGSLSQAPVDADWESLFANYKVDILVIRYGLGNISKQQIRQRQQHGPPLILEPERETGFANLKSEERRGFGDALTTDFLSEFLPFVDYKSSL
jgi:sugar/nucleoside kinase (ribokinase family)